MSHAKTPPTLPTVVDEAGDSPNWVPALGFALFALVSLMIGVRLYFAQNTAADQAAEAAAVVAEQPEAK